MIIPVMDTFSSRQGNVCTEIRSLTPALANNKLQPRQGEGHSNSYFPVTGFGSHPVNKKGQSVKVFWCCDVHFVFLLGMSFPGAGTGLVFVRMRLIWFLFSLASHCEIIPTVASEPRSLSLLPQQFSEEMLNSIIFFFFQLSQK